MFKNKIRKEEASPYDCSKGGLILIKKYEEREREKLRKIRRREW